MTDQPPLTRRQLLQRGSAAALAAAGLTAGAFWLHGREGTLAEDTAVEVPRFGVELPPGAPALAIARGRDPDALVKAVLGELGGIEHFIRPGDRVLIKPNVAFDRPPALGATTSPEMLAAVIRQCRAARAGKIVVTDNPINSPAGAFQKSGITRAAGEAGADILLPAPDQFGLAHIGGQVLTDWETLLKPLLWADRVIGIAPCKDHNLSGASLTMKNWYGFLGGGRNRFHQDIHNVIADLAMMITPTLVFLDGTRVLMSNGPTGGSLNDVAEGNTLVCGVDSVAIDAWGYANLLGRDDRSLEYLQLATGRGIGNMDWRNQVLREITL